MRQKIAGYRQRIYENYGKNFQDANSSFDRLASARWGRARNYHLRRWIPKDKNAKIVDLACGGGRLLDFFVRQGFGRVEGVDISTDQVELSRQVVTKVTQANVIEFLESRPRKFDLITGFDIVEHFYKDEVMHFLDAAYAALNVGGRLILQTPNAECPWGAHHRYNDFTHEVGFNPNSLGRLLSLVGFGSVQSRECDPVPWGYSVSSSIRYLLWQGIRAGLMVYNIIETGSTGDRIFTRVFLISGVRNK